MTTQLCLNLTDRMAIQLEKMAQNTGYGTGAKLLEGMAKTKLDDYQAQNHPGIDLEDDPEPDIRIAAEYALKAIEALEVILVDTDPHFPKIHSAANAVVGLIDSIES